MIPRRLLDLTRKPLSAFQAFFRQENSLNYQRPALQTTQEESQNEENNSNQDQKYQNNSNSDYSYYGRYMGFGAILPLFAVMTHKLNTVSCFFGGSKLESDKLTNRISLLQYPSNNPIEDRWAVAQLEAVPGYVTMVFDGHGGWQVAEFARENLPKELEKALKANKEKSFASEEEYIKTSILEAFDRVEEDFLKVAKDAYANGYAGIGKVGACALVTLVTGNKVYVANAGDCQGVLCKNQDGKYALQRLNSKLNANSKKEQKRLKEQFQDEDIYYCKRGDNKACYVKRRLQPTRAFGDFHLKHEEFNNPNKLGTDLGYRSRLENFRGPYITHVPVIKVFDLTPSDKYMILSSDGMWDELSKNDVAKLSEKNLGDKQKFTTELLNNALKVAAGRIRMSEDEIRNIPVGHRRNYHDDMTIIVVDLEGQAR